MKLSRQTTIEASAERVWRIVAHQFDRIGDWATVIQTSRANPQAVGPTDAPVAGRVCETGLRRFPSVEETILAYDDASRALTYVGRGMPAFVAHAWNHWQVTPLGDDRARVALEATLETRGIIGWLLRVPLRLQLHREGSRMLEDLKHYAEKGRPSPRKQRRLVPQALIETGFDPRLARHPPSKKGSITLRKRPKRPS